MKTITVKIGPLGTIHMDAEGFVGQGCKRATKVLVDAIGGKTTESNDKPEAYMDDGVGVHDFTNMRL